LTDADRILQLTSQNPMRVFGKVVSLTSFSIPQSGGRCVQVTGVKGLEIDDLCTILENKRKGGGPVETVEPKNDDPIVVDSVLVTFEDETGEYTFL